MVQTVSLMGLALLLQAKLLWEGLRNTHVSPESFVAESGMATTARLLTIAGQQAEQPAKLRTNSQLIFYLIGILTSLSREPGLCSAVQNESRDYWTLAALNNMLCIVCQVTLLTTPSSPQFLGSSRHIRHHVSK